MSNMSYCRFGNTLDDLEDCRHFMTNRDSLKDMDLSTIELSSLERMVECCSEIVEMYRLMKGNDYEA